MARPWICALAALLLTGCVSPGEDRCDRIADPTSREACRGDTVRDERAKADARGVGPPSCHPASTNPDLDNDRC
jgi:hypothetical protein